jgi:bifunctional non-homologous end joining protein LigD
MSTQTELRIQGRTLKLSNLDKVLYPKVGFTKAQVIDYYVRVSRVLLPHLKNRALTLKRYPDGVEKEFFYEKRCPSFRPPWVRVAPVWSVSRREKIPFGLANDLPSLIWAANLADLELHTSLALYKNPDRPTMMVFDLDPGTGAGLLHCAEVALWLRDLFQKRKLKSFAKTSGSKGLQVCVPLNTAVTFARTKMVARAVAEWLSREHPDKVLARMEKRLRTGKVFIDWSQNDRHKTTICVYSLRAKDRPTVSTPLAWKKVEDALTAGAPDRLSFETDDVLKRITSRGDLFEAVLALRQRLPEFD